MSYKIKNGIIFVRYQGAWWRDDVLFTIYPELRNTKLVKE